METERPNTVKGKTLRRRTKVALAVALALAAAAALVASVPVTSVLNVLSGGAPTVADVAYGTDPRQRYDVYRAGADAPVVVFVHGGSWDTGEKDMYRFVGNALRKAGFTAVVVEYRLAPQTVFPGFVEDVAAAASHARRTVAGGAPVAIVGHSAGAQIAALLAHDPRYLAAHGLSPCETFSGFVGLSGPYDFLPLDQARYKRIFPEASWAASQPIAFAGNAGPPALLLHGTADATVHAEDTTLMAAALADGGTHVRALLLDGVDHSDTIGAFGPGLAWLAPVREPVFRFLRERAGRPGC